MKNFSLKVRLLSYSTLVVVLVVAIISSMFLYFYQKDAWKAHDMRATSILESLANDLELATLLGDKPAIERHLEYIVTLPDVISTSVYDQKGELLGRAEGALIDVPKEYHVKLTSNITVKPTEVMDEMMAFPAPKPSEVIGKVEVIFSAYALQTSQANMVTLVILITLIALFLKAVADYFFVTGITRPLHKLVDVSQAIADGDLEQKITLEGENEIGRLATAFNKMIDALRKRDEKLTEQHEELAKSYDELQKTNEELLVSKEAAEEANRLKSEFLANMSHELRTPLNAIIGFTYILKGTQLTDEQQEFLDAVNSSGDSLLSMINEILDLNRMESGELTIVNNEFNLRYTLEKGLMGLEKKAKLKGLEFELSIDPKIPRLLLGDAGRIRQVVLSLVNNAIKFTLEGKIHVEVKAAESSEEKLQLLFSVKDTGVGIPDDKKNIVFDSFRQVDGSNTRRFGGTGLGGAIAKKLVELMNGKIWFESLTGKGSTFFFSIELAVSHLQKSQFPVPQAKPQDESSTAIIRKEPSTHDDFAGHLLIAEDDYQNQKVIKSILERRGYKVQVAANGREALEMWEKHKFRMILMDIQMPELDGLETTEIIREREKEMGVRIPIIAMTAYALQGDKEKCLNTGMDAYLSKPLDVNKLFEYIQEFSQDSFSN